MLGVPSSCNITSQLSSNFKQCSRLYIMCGWHLAKYMYPYNRFQLVDVSVSGQLVRIAESHSQMVRSDHSAALLDFLELST